MLIVLNDIVNLSKKIKSIIYFLDDQIEGLFKYLEGNLSKLILIESNISKYDFFIKDQKNMIIILLFRFSCK